jgi:two-component system, chemotaxis family, response regulator Rcp1
MQSSRRFLADFEILLVEGSPADVWLAQEAFKDANIQVKLHIATDGTEAMDFIKRAAKGAESPHPDLILLDLTLPKKSGLELLAELKADPQLKSIPVVILSTSAAQVDATESYQLHADCYMAKPVDLDVFLNVIKRIQHSWLSTVRRLQPGYSLFIGH